MKHIKILVVEDELIVSREIEKSLTRLGHEVIATISSGDEALRFLDQRNIDLVLLDINIDGSKNGIDVATVSKHQYNIPVIFLTALSDEATLEKAKVAEPYGYIVKPFEDHDLKVGVEMAYYKYTLESESTLQQYKMAQAFSQIDDALITLNSSYDVDFINPTAVSFSGKKNLKNDELLHISKLIEFYTPTRGKIPYSYFFNYSSEIMNEKVICYFPYRQTELELHVKTHRIVKEKDVIGWALILSEQVLILPDESSLHQYPNSPTTSCIFVKKGKRHMRVNFEDILWLEATDNFVIIHTIKEQFVLYITLKELEAKLPSEHFVKIHRSYVIRVDKITYVEEDYVKIGDKMLPISRSFKKGFKQKAIFV